MKATTAEKPRPERFRPPASTILQPLAWGYRAVVAGRNLLYDLNILSAASVPVPVICVGNLTTGGTGKTPMVAWLAAFFHRQGRRVAVLSRGYKRRGKRRPLLLLPGDPPPPVRETGDEPAMLLASRPEIALAVDPRRHRGAENLCRRWSPEIIIMDDGFQHRRLRRRLDIVMVDSQRLFGNGRLLPAGPLREPLAALQRADILVCNKFDQRHPRFTAAAAEMLSYLPPGRIFTATYKLQHCRSVWAPCEAVGRKQLRGRTAVAFAGLGNPDYFFRQLAAAGVELQAQLVFPDHHDYRTRDLERLSRIAADVPLLLTTAKDAVKIAALPTAARLLPRLHQVDITLQLADSPRFNKLLESGLSLGYSASQDVPLPDVGTGKRPPTQGKYPA